MSDTAADAPVLTERRDNVLLITLNRPDQRNAVNGAIADGVAAALDTLDGDDGARGRRADRRRQGLLLGDGPRRRSPPASARGTPSAASPGIVQKPPRKPIIAAVEGFAVAGGLEIALACDLIVASAGAKLGIPEVKRSLVAAGGALLRLPRVLPSGDRDGARPDGRPDQRRARLRARARQPRGRAGDGASTSRSSSPATIARNGPLAHRRHEDDPRTSSGTGAEDDFWHKQGEISGPVFGSEDAREGAIAFSEKRDPVWKGR